MKTISDVRELFAEGFSGVAGAVVAAANVVVLVEDVAGTVAAVDTVADVFAAGIVVNFEQGVQIRVEPIAPVTADVVDVRSSPLPFVAESSASSSLPTCSVQFVHAPLSKQDHSKLAVLVSSSSA